MKKFSIGIDFSKETFDATILDREYNQLDYSKFSNNKQGFNDFLKWTRTVLKNVGSKDLKSGFSVVNIRVHAVSD